MARWPEAHIAVASMIALVLAGGGPGWAVPEHATFTCSPFRMVHAPPVEGGHASGIDSTSPSDVWTVGLGPRQPTILHWDGTRWSVSPQDDLDGSSSSLAAINPSDAWLVGETPPQGPTPMSKHWDGTLWRSVPVPLVGTDDNLTSVTALATDDVWAAGQHNSGGPIHPLVMHWDGTSWTQVPTPDKVPNATNYFYGIDAISPTDIWAVGYVDVSLNSKPLIEHWDGVAWTVSPTPSFPGNDNILFEVSAASSDDVWAVGFQGDTFTELRTLAMHWDGTDWSIIPTPNLEGDQEAFLGVDAVSSTDAWAVGIRQPQYPSEFTLVEHWDGARWNLVKSPPTNNGGFDGVQAVASTQVWAVGGVFDPDIADTRPLTMRSQGCGSA